MKKLAGLLLVLSFLRIGFAYADTNTVNSVEYLTGTSDAVDPVNQILVTLIGPQGEPGAAGVAGKDGVNGINGIDGTNGIDGAPGAAGAPGAPGESVQLAGNATTVECPSGGKVYAVGTTRTVICNGVAGANGAAGATGATGATGSAGGGGGGTIGFGQGEVTVGACDTDGKIYVKFKTKFDINGFVFDSFQLVDTSTVIDGVTYAAQEGGVNSGCSGETTKIYFKILSTGLVDPYNKYNANDIVYCSYNLPASPWSTASREFNLTADVFGQNCFVYQSGVANTAGTGFRLDEISSMDIVNKIGFEIGN